MASMDSDTQSLLTTHHTAVLRELDGLRIDVKQIESLSHSIDNKVGQHQGRLDRHEHDIRNLKQVHMPMREVRDSDRLSAKALAVVIAALGGAAAAVLGVLYGRG